MYAYIASRDGIPVDLAVFNTRPEAERFREDHPDAGIAFDRIDIVQVTAAPDLHAYITDEIADFFNNR